MDNSTGHVVYLNLILILQIWTNQMKHHSTWHKAWLLISSLFFDSQRTFELSSQALCCIEWCFTALLRLSKSVCKELDLIIWTVEYTSFSYKDKSISLSLVES